MLKVRIIPTLLYKNFGLVKGTAFNSWRRVGGVLQAVKVYNLREVDELIFLDISATLEGRSPDFSLIDDIADECFMPLTVGGGIRTLDDVTRLLKVGADKIAINTIAVENPSFIQSVADTFGSQCVVVSIDYVRVDSNRHEVYSHSGRKATGLSPEQFAMECERLGAGELLLTSIDNDGMMNGYDLECLRRVAETVSIPVIASGGAGNFQHMVEALHVGKASAVAAASMFHFTEQTPLEAKAYLKMKDIPVRIINEMGSGHASC
jgi:cyclase